MAAARHDQLRHRLLAALSRLEDRATQPSTWAELCALARDAQPDDVSTFLDVLTKTNRHHSQLAQREAVRLLTVLADAHAGAFAAHAPRVVSSLIARIRDKESGRDVRDAVIGAVGDLVRTVAPRLGSAAPFFNPLLGALGEQVEATQATAAACLSAALRAAGPLGDDVAARLHGALLRLLHHGALRAQPALLAAAGAFLTASGDAARPYAPSLTAPLLAACTAAEFATRKAAAEVVALAIVAHARALAPQSSKLLAALGALKADKSNVVRAAAARALDDAQRALDDAAALAAPPAARRAGSAGGARNGAGGERARAAHAAASELREQIRRDRQSAPGAGGWGWEVTAKEPPSHLRAHEQRPPLSARSEPADPPGGGAWRRGWGEAGGGGDANGWNPHQHRPPPPPRSDGGRGYAAGARAGGCPAGCNDDAYEARWDGSLSAEPSLYAESVGSEYAPSIHACAPLSARTAAGDGDGGVNGAYAQGARARAGDGTSSGVESDSGGDGGGGGGVDGTVDPLGVSIVGELPPRAAHVGGGRYARRHSFERRRHSFERPARSDVTHTGPLVRAASADQAVVNDAQSNGVWSECSTRSRAVSRGAAAASSASPERASGSRVRLGAGPDGGGAGPAGGGAQAPDRRSRAVWTRDRGAVLAMLGLEAEHGAADAERGVAGGAGAHASDADRDAARDAAPGTRGVRDDEQRVAPCGALSGSLALFPPPGQRRASILLSPSPALVSVPPALSLVALPASNLRYAESNSAPCARTEAARAPNAPLVSAPPPADGGAREHCGAAAPPISLLRPRVAPTADHALQRMRDARSPEPTHMPTDAHDGSAAVGRDGDGRDDSDGDGGDWPTCGDGRCDDGDDGDGCSDVASGSRGNARAHGAAAELAALRSELASAQQAARASADTAAVAVERARARADAAEVEAAAATARAADEVARAHARTAEAVQRAEARAAGAEARAAEAEARASAARADAAAAADEASVAREDARERAEAAAAAECARAAQQRELDAAMRGVEAAEARAASVERGAAAAQAEAASALSALSVTVAQLEARLHDASGRELAAGAERAALVARLDADARAAVAERVALAAQLRAAVDAAGAADAERAEIGVRLHDVAARLLEAEAGRAAALERAELAEAAVAAADGSARAERADAEATRAALARAHAAAEEATNACAAEAERTAERARDADAQRASAARAADEAARARDAEASARSAAEADALAARGAAAAAEAARAAAEQRAVAAEADAADARGAQHAAEAGCARANAHAQAAGAHAAEQVARADAAERAAAEAEGSLVDALGRLGRLQLDHNKAVEERDIADARARDALAAADAADARALAEAAAAADARAAMAELQARARELAERADEAEARLAERAASRASGARPRPGVGAWQPLPTKEVAFGGETPRGGRQPLVPTRAGARAAPVSTAAAARAAAAAAAHGMTPGGGAMAGHAAHGRRPSGAAAYGVPAASAALAARLSRP
ncbi:hypothetical protein KFE25_014152 [Diacronema lutheri]|uniref:TORTIFOLIA1/SINE1-2 N-terminal domain-containing protein n=1 Tax=Diacronema lutheri TaxID=2081491 RepID=A0A8J6C200_DIALT|nr:hypothetical protein KFE25_014152 [Diacronema lutheri]